MSSYDEDTIIPESIFKYSGSYTVPANKYAVLHVASSDSSYFFPFLLPFDEGQSIETTVASAPGSLVKVYPKP